MKVFGCLRTTIEHIQITAPTASPNTNGIHIGSSTNTKIFNSLIATGDDCVSIDLGTENLQVSGVTCGPGLGISIGSLGKYANEADVKNLVIQNCNLTGTDNGVRIKTWAPSPPSIVYNVTFENISMKDVVNPIIIDQQYCPSGGTQALSQVQITGVKLKNIFGTSKNKVAVNLNCSPSKPSQNIDLTDIDLIYNRQDGAATSSSFNARGIARGSQEPPSCL
ncbi:exopolygalacturonase clone GBGA483-like [Humulus lupulus]|uniref:exopolygalacturonase clone GBGA483-like n=1 Tax=Humulus lupulus TaxID=3486 RepID=UPI002B40D276|nr:exopolygalacturonase clone GBGA483-like [Humulus lupulus]